MIFQMTGGSLEKPFALITVNYPSGSTLTATNVSGYKDVTATQRLYYVKKPSGLTQACDFTITDGTHTKSKTVSGITVGTSQTITLTYQNPLLLDGATENADFSNSIFSGYGTIGSFSYNNEWTMSAYGASVSIWRHCYVDLTDYTTLSFRAWKGASNNMARFAISDSVDAAFDSNIASQDVHATSYTDYTIDISGITGYHYVGFGTITNAVVTGVTCYCNKILLS